VTFEWYISDYLAEFDARNVEFVNYREGCLMTGVQCLFEATGLEYYKNFIVRFGEKYVSDDGMIKGFDVDDYNVDRIRAGTVLFFLLNETGDLCYKKAIDIIMDNLRSYPRTSEGSFWHKSVYPYQVWLDGLYMAQPFYLLYDNAFENCANYNDIVEQFKLVRKYMFCEEKKLYHHAWDEKRALSWADKETGRSPNFWLRAIGWWLMALVDCYDLIKEEAYDHRRVLQDLLNETVSGLMPYREKGSGMFYQLVDLADVEGNYLETSGSAMVAYSLLKGSRNGMLLPEKYAPIAKEILLSIQANMLPWNNGFLSLQNICGGAGLGTHPEQGRYRDGSVAYYLAEKIVPDNLHGAAALFMAYAEYLKSCKLRDDLI